MKYAHAVLAVNSLASNASESHVVVGGISMRPPNPSRTKDGFQFLRRRCCRILLPRDPLQTASQSSCFVGQSLPTRGMQIPTICVSPDAADGPSDPRLQLEFTSPCTYFRFDVPQRSRNSSTLANAFFALSPQHLAYTQDYDPLVADQYYSACLDQLIPVLSNEDAALDDALLTATILLRMLEEMAGKLAPLIQFHSPADLDPAAVGIVVSDSHGHLTGIAALIRAAQEQLGANKKPVPPVPR
ncbi:uncharacterized protein IWZ02DRAFT_484599 [Phyllosticta citriasiana]|uniref:uncharacterized protein n=1 Tax=Phyllosticta citriasiana TaxID=595635 RepID=UPI0030FD9EFD